MLRRARFLRVPPVQCSFKRFSSGRQLENFDDASIAFRDKSTFELLRALVVFKCCTVSPLVNNADTLFKFGERFAGKALTHWVCKQTFFGHFCGGETHEGIKPAVRRLEGSGIGAVLDYAAEVLPVLTFPSNAQADVESAQPKDGVVSARMHEYEDERMCDLNAALSVEAIQSAANQEDGFAAIKMTALGRPEFLLMMSENIKLVQAIFVEIKKVCDVAGRVTRPQGLPDSQLVSYDVFVEGLRRFGVTEEESVVREVFDLIDADGNGEIDLGEWLQSLAIETLHRHPLYTLLATTQPDMLRSLTDVQQTELENLVKRTIALAQLAADKGVKLMVDAEQTYYQPAIDHVVLQLQKACNKDKPVIFNTYQCYLRDALARVEMDMETAVRQGYCFAAKVVRGAYMTQERARAVERGYADPVNPTLEATSAMYHNVVETVIRNQERCRSSIMVASHNEHSVLFTVRLMQELGITTNVYFGQLLGMCDFISYTLGAHGYKVYKYMPYGPVDEVLPYLIRRARENSDMLVGGVAKERQLLVGEVKQRLFSR